VFHWIVPNQHIFSTLFNNVQLVLTIIISIVSFQNFQAEIVEQTSDEIFAQRHNKKEKLEMTRHHRNSEATPAIVQPNFAITSDCTVVVDDILIPPPPSSPDQSITINNEEPTPEIGGAGEWTLRLMLLFSGVFSSLTDGIYIIMLYEYTVSILNLHHRYLVDFWLYTHTHACGLFYVIWVEFFVALL